MDDGIKQLRVRFSGEGQEEQGSDQTITIPPQQGTLFGRGQMSNGEVYDPAYAATVAAVAYAIAAKEKDKLESEEKPIPQKFISRKKPIAIHEPTDAPPFKRGESLKKPAEGSKISRWFGSKEPAEDGDDHGQGDNVLVRRPLKPVQKKPGGLVPAENVVGSAPNIKKDPSFARKTPEKKGSRKFEQEQAIHRRNPEVEPTSSFPREKNESRKFEQDLANQRAPPTARPSVMAVSGEAETMAAAWEKDKLAKIKKRYNEAMETIAEWEAEKKAKARRQKEPREGDSERKRAKALEEYNDEMKRISKVAAASRLTAEEKKRSAEANVWEKAAKIRSTGKLPQSCSCF